jgi:acyl-CoA dehydrogenase
MPSPYWSPEQEAFRHGVRRFISDEVLPFADQWERDQRLPDSLWRAFGGAGLLGLLYPTVYGGANRGLFHSVIFLEELGRSGYAGLRAAISVHAYMATHYLAKTGTEMQQRDYLAPAIAGERIAALAITEEQAGSDLAALQTVALQNARGYTISGQKTFVTNGTSAHFALVAAHSASTLQLSSPTVTDLSLFIVDLDKPGVTRRSLRKLGWHCCDTAEVSFDRVEVSAAHLIGRVKSGFMQLMQGFQLERLVAAALALGGMDRCVEITLRRLCDRPICGHPVVEYQALRHRMADLITEIEATRQLVYYAAWLYENGDRLPIAQCLMAKLKATELATQVATECLHMHGSQGYREDAEIARLYRDAPAGTLAAGTSEVLRDAIAQLALEDEAFRRSL